MGNYSIKDLEKLTGIKAHTLRIWEQRYGLLKPGRSETNIRLYDREDLRLMLRVSALYAGGMRISKIAEMSSEEMCGLVRRQNETESGVCGKINALITATIDFDEEVFEKIISDSISKQGFEQTIIDVIYPFLDRIGVLWTAKTICPAQEHFVSNLIRQKVIAAVDRQFVPKVSRKSSFLLFLPENEFHEIGLLFASYLLRARGFKVWYLGQNMPFSDLENAFSVRKPSHLFSMITTPRGSDKTDNFLCRLKSAFQSSQIWISGGQADAVCACKENNENLLVIRSVQEFIEQADRTE